MTALSSGERGTARVIPLSSEEDEEAGKLEGYGTYGHSLPYSTVNHCMPLCHAVTATFSRAWTRQSR